MQLRIFRPLYLMPHVPRIECPARCIANQHYAVSHLWKIAIYFSTILFRSVDSSKKTNVNFRVTRILNALTIEQEFQIKKFSTKESIKGVFDFFYAEELQLHYCKADRQLQQMLHKQRNVFCNAIRAEDCKRGAKNRKKKKTMVNSLSYSLQYRHFLFFTKFLHINALVVEFCSFITVSFIHRKSRDANVAVLVL